MVGSRTFGGLKAGGGPDVSELTLREVTAADALLRIFTLDHFRQDKLVQHVAKAFCGPSFGSNQLKGTNVEVVCVFCLHS